MKVLKNLIHINFEIGRPQWSGNPFVVIHTYGGKGTNLRNWFETNTVGVSSHFSIEKDGTIRQYVEIDNTAYANGTPWSNSNGVSVEFQDDGNYNDPNTYTQAQFDAFAWLFVTVINPWASGRIANNEHGITPHNKWTPKECPGKLWDRRNELYLAIDKLMNPINTELEELKKENATLKKKNEELVLINVNLETKVGIMQGWLDDKDKVFGEQIEVLQLQISGLKSEVAELKKPSETKFNLITFIINLLTKRK